MLKTRFCFISLTCCGKDRRNGQRSGRWTVNGLSANRDAMIAPVRAQRRLTVRSRFGSFALQLLRSTLPQTTDMNYAHRRLWNIVSLSALPPKADSIRNAADVCYVQILLQKSKIERRQKSRESRFLKNSTAATLLHRRCEGPWSFSWETMRTLTSPYTKRISSPRKFRSAPQKDFCNNICKNRKSVITLIAQDTFAVITVRRPEVECAPGFS
jgi:hypothetical protein